MPETNTIGITGAGGLLGWHTQVHLRALNAAASYRGEPEPVRWRVAHTSTFDSAPELVDFVKGCDTIIHFAGINRGSDAQVEFGNIEIAKRLVQALTETGSTPNLIFANSTHASSDSPYGRGKAKAAQLLSEWAARVGANFVDLILPHVFGEHGRPNYNSVTATFCEMLVRGEAPQVNPEGRVELVHAGTVAERVIAAGVNSEAGQVRMEGQPLSIPELLDRLVMIDQQYRANVIPDLSEPFDLQIFNTYRSYIPVERRLVDIPVNTDNRGHLFETVKGGGGGQTFVSWTKPGVIRGNHFHLNKAERFLVLQGEARIKLRRVGHEDVHEFSVCGDRPAFIDIPTLHTHSIENTGSEPLVTLFWAHEIFNSAKPDTYMEMVE